MKLSKWLCPWCETRRLQYVEGYLRRPFVSGVKLVCSNPGADDCPDTTGLCKTEAEADRYAAELCFKATTA